MSIATLLGGAGTALADSVTLSVLNTAGASDPVVDVSRIFKVSGNATAPKNLYIKYRAPGGAACGPTADGDSGTYLSGFTSYDTPVNGDFNFENARTWSGAGAYVFCYWLAASETTITTPFTQTITFRQPTGTITATINPASPRPEQEATVTVTGSSESPKRVYAKVRAAGGAACSQTYDADSGTSLLYGDRVNGSFTLTATTKQSTAGNYVVCLWLADSDTDAKPVAGPQPQPFTVAAPPTPPPPPAPRLIGSSITGKRQGVRNVRYSGRISTLSSCRRNRTVVLRRVGSGARSFGRTTTRADGTYTIRRARRLKGRVYVVTTRSKRGTITCTASRSANFRG